MLYAGCSFGKGSAEDRGVARVAFLSAQGHLVDETGISVQC